MMLASAIAMALVMQLPAHEGLPEKSKTTKMERCDAHCQKVQVAEFVLFVEQLLHPCGDQPATLAAFMVSVNPRVVWDAQTLACGIFREARRHDLDPAALAAIVWMESWFDSRAKGAAGERGYWQLWPGARKAAGWEYLTWKGAQRAAMDVDRATTGAIRVIATFVHWCRAKGGAHRDHRRPTDAYAHYNTGYGWPRPGYSRLLWRRTKLIRRVLAASTVALDTSAN